jgi:hypothetical protein
MFTPIVATGGLTGWTLLNRTLERQTQLFNTAPALQRDTEYFRQNISDVQDAEALVSDRRLLRVALGAFGLGDDINNRAFIKTILEQGTEERDALANRLSDDRYRRFADAFAFLDGAGPRDLEAGFAARIVDQFQRREFENAVGEQDASLRIALNADRELAAIATEPGSENALWFRILGSPPLRKAFDVALGLPESFAQLDLDRQLDEIKSRAAQRLDIQSPRDLADKETRETLTRQFILRDQINDFAVTSSQSIAVTLLQTAPRLF